MIKDFFAFSVSNEDHYTTMKKAYHLYNVILDPHGAVGWRVLEAFLKSKHNLLSVVYETADPGKFPNDIQIAIGVTPELPHGMKKQAALEERVYSVESKSEHTKEGLKLSDAQIKEAKEKIREIFS
jgi:threonine synthase